jgi:hypothetical protein
MVTSIHFSSTKVQKISQKGEKKKMRENWTQSDNLKLIHQYDFAWDCIKQDFHQNQHCKTEETEETLEKRWENLKRAQSKYQKEFKYTIHIVSDCFVQV